MKRMTRSIPVLLGIYFLSATAGAQITLTPSVIASGGGHAEAGNISISWTLGELAVTTLTGDGMILTQGFQQPFDIGVGFRPEEADWKISVYPNPVADELRIRFGLENPQDFLVEIQDVTGRILVQQQYRQILPGEILQINTSEFMEGVYFLKLSSPERDQVKVVSIRKI